jgi:hypothetical protein
MSDPHNRTKQQKDNDEEDPFETMLNKAGCLNEHYKVQECMADTKDWRICQPHVKAFRECIEKSKKKK